LNGHQTAVQGYFEYPPRDAPGITKDPSNQRHLAVLVLSNQRFRDLVKYITFLDVDKQKRLSSLLVAESHSQGLLPELIFGNVIEQVNHFENIQALEKPCILSRLCASVSFPFYGPRSFLLMPFLGFIIPAAPEWTPRYLTPFRNRASVIQIALSTASQ
jgi:hypothetical protein